MRLVESSADDAPWLRLAASAGLSSRLDGTHARVREGALKIGQIAAERRAVGLDEDAQITAKSWAKQHSLASFAGYRPGHPGVHHPSCFLGGRGADPRRHPSLLRLDRRADASPFTGYPAAA